MRISRIIQNFFTPEVFDDVNNKVEKIERAFHEILEEEHARLMQLVKKSQKNGTPVQLYQKYNPRLPDNMFYDE